MFGQLFESWPQEAAGVFIVPGSKVSVDNGLLFRKCSRHKTAIRLNSQIGNLCGFDPMLYMSDRALAGVYSFARGVNSDRAIHVDHHPVTSCK